MDDRATLGAGNFGAWLDDMEAALRGERPADVPCGSCTACCTSSQFIHIEPDETDTLAHIPPDLVFEAPGAPAGHVLMGYDERGHCPMLVEGACTIYAHRPRTCRTYDCRALAATDTTLDDATRDGIEVQVRRWRFAHPAEQDRLRHHAVQAAADYLRAHGEAFPAGVVPANPTQLAVLAIEVHELFLSEPDPARVRAALRRRLTR